MKRAGLFLCALLTAGAASAQSFTLGGRYSNYSTEVGVAGIDFESGRQSSFGLLGSYRNGPLGLNFQLDHDIENGIGLVDLLPFDFAEYSRDRAEAALSYTLIPNLDIEGGVRAEQVTVGGSSFFGAQIFSDLDLTHQALFAGVNFHSRTIRPVGWYASARGYIGTAQFDSFGVSVDDDTTGMKFEAGLPIPIGLSGWEIAPGFEYERIESDQFDLKLETNRFFVNVAYTFGR